jgi:hypothetical protein
MSRKPNLHVPLSSASSAALPPPSHGSGSGWFRYSCHLRLFHSPLHAGLSRRYPGGSAAPALRAQSAGAAIIGSRGTERRINSHSSRDSGGHTCNRSADRLVGAHAADARLLAGSDRGRSRYGLGRGQRANRGWNLFRSRSCIRRWGAGHCWLRRVEQAQDSLRRRSRIRPRRWSAGPASGFRQDPRFVRTSGLGPARHRQQDSYGV